jgi:hypothetical protein
VIAGAHDEIKKFIEYNLAAPGATEEARDALISLTTRRLARTVQEFVQQAATVSEEVALTMHKTGEGNIICRFHQKCRSDVKHDGLKDNKKGYSIEGVAFKKTLGGDCQPGHMHCGCAIDDVLLEFIFWKTTSIRSTNPALENLEETFPRHFDSGAVSPPSILPSKCPRFCRSIPPPA